MPFCDDTKAQRISTCLNDCNARVSLSKPISNGGAVLTLCVTVQPKDAENERELSLDLAQLNQNYIQTLVEEAVAILSSAPSGDCCKTYVTASQRGGYRQGGPAPMPVSAPTQTVEENDTLSDLAGHTVDQSRCACWSQGKLVSSCRRGQLLMLQPWVAPQRHQNACGYHALYNAQMLLTAADALAQGVAPSADVFEAFQDERGSCRKLLAALHMLQTKPPEGRSNSSQWKPATIRGCTLDQCHIRHLLALDPTLARRIFIAEAEVRAGVAEAKDAIVDLAKGKGEPVALILGCVTHWLAAAVACTPDGPVLLLADSFNKCLLSSIPSAELAEKIVEERFPGFVEKIRAEMPRYVEAPETVLRELFETGVPEWWKGKEKSSVYWKHRPAPLRRHLQEMEIEAVYAYLDELEKLLIDKSNL